MEVTHKALIGRINRKFQCRALNPHRPSRSRRRTGLHFGNRHGDRSMNPRDIERPDHDDPPEDPPNDAAEVLAGSALAVVLIGMAVHFASQYV